MVECKCPVCGKVFIKQRYHVYKTNTGASVCSYTCMLKSEKKPKKYRNSKVVLDGITFDSQKEASRWCELKAMQKLGLIENLQRQVSFVLIPAQREPSGEVYVRGAKKGQPKEGKVVENSVCYIADFVYTDKKSGQKVVEDSKGVRTKEYVIKRKLMLYIHGIRIKET